MDVELTPERQDRLAEAGYVLAPALDPVPVRGRIRVQDGAGQPLDLELVDLPDGARETCIAHLSAWFPVADPGVEHLVDALDLDDAIGYLTAVAAPCTLETYVATTGRLGAGHTSTVLVTLGRTLARLHAQGLRYGPIRPRDVLVDAGRVLLTVPKPAWTAETPMMPSPQEDAYHLAYLADAVIAPAHGPTAPERPEPGLRGLVKLIISAMGDADSRPGVGTLATLSHDLAPCLPLDPPRCEAPADGAPQDSLEHEDAQRPAGPEVPRRPALDRPAARRRAYRGSTPRRSPESSDDRRAPLRETRAARVVDPQPARRPRWVTGVVVISVLAGLGGGAIVVHRVSTGSPADTTTGGAAARGTSADGGVTGSAAAGGPVPGPPATLQSSGEDPGAAATRLTVARMDRVVALTNAAVPPGGAPDGAVPDAGVPDGGPPVDEGWTDLLVPDSPAHLQAAELVANLQSAGARISGLTVEIGGAVVVSHAPSSAQVEVTFTVGSYTLESVTGSQTVPASAPRTAVLELVTTDSGWLVAGVQEVTATS